MRIDTSSNAWQQLDPIAQEYLIETDLEQRRRIVAEHFGEAEAEKRFGQLEDLRERFYYAMDADITSYATWRERTAPDGVCLQKR